MVSLRIVSSIISLIILLDGVALGQRDINRRRRQEKTNPGVRLRTLPDAPYRVFRQRLSRKKRPSVPISAPTADQAFITPTITPAHVTCPPAYDPKRIDYVAGDVVKVYNTIFQCRPSPYEKYCNIATLELLKLLHWSDDGLDLEGAQMLWLDAWMEVGECGTAAATAPSGNDDFMDDPLNPPLIPAEFSFAYSPPPDSAPSEIPPTKSPTWHPTYSPTTPYPTYLPTSFP